MAAYTDADVQAAAGLLVEAPLGCSEEQDVRLILDAVAPAIAARAQAAILREIADDYAQVDDSYLSDRADQIERDYL